MLYIISIPICGEQTGNKLKLQPLILPSTGHARDLGDAQLQPRGSRRLTCLDLPRDPVPRRLSHLSLLGDPSARDPRKSTCLKLPRDLVSERLSCLNLLRDPPVWWWGVGRRAPGGQNALTCPGIWSSKGCHASTCSGICQSRSPRKAICLDLPKDSVSRRLSCLSLPEDLHPDPGTPCSQVATVLGRISFRKTHP